MGIEVILHDLFFLQLGSAKGRNGRYSGPSERDTCRDLLPETSMGPGHSVEGTLCGFAFKGKLRFYHVLLERKPHDSSGSHPTKTA